jgi:hypothetical protein
MTSKPDSPFAAKARWHAEQRQLPPRAKIRILIELQRREAESDRVRIALGRPASGIRPWNTQA